MWALFLLLTACAAPPAEQLPQGVPNYPTATPNPQPEGVPAVAARGLTVSAITVNQAVQIDVMRGFEPIEPVAPIVAGKDALVRAHFAPHLDWEPREVRGVLTVATADRVWLFEDTLLLEGPSNDGDPSTTIGGVVPAEHMQAGAAVKVAVYEADGIDRPEQSEGRTAWPEGEPHPLTFADWGGPIPIRLLPVIYAADGTDRAPDTSDEQLELLRDYLVRMYPATDFEFSLEPELVWEEEIPSGGGLNDLLDRIVDLREEREIPSHHYLYGLVNPAESWLAFCAQGCTAGLSFRPDNPNRSWMRSSVSLGFEGIKTAETFAHELGHAHGRKHAPCGPAQQTDPDFPYAGGLIGSMGWDGVELIAPGFTGDIMGYCSPKWISDYQYAALFERVAAMNGLFDEERDAVNARWIAEGGDGALKDRGVRSRVLEGGEEVQLKLMVDGQSVPATAHFYGLDDAEGGAWLVPELGATSIAWPDGRWVDLE